ncbi:MAG: S16 family serine protease, partial [Deltaproteobacteria bacterium]
LDVVEDSELSGPSLGLSAAVALVSRWTETAPDPRVAGTAEVMPSGKLRRVGGIDAKLRALQSRWPDVRVIALATAQSDVAPDMQAAFAIRYCDTVADALSVFGLALDKLPRATAEVAEAALSTFASLNADHREPSQWRALSSRARAAAHILGVDTDKGAECLSWAALFSLHAGDADTDLGIVAGVPADLVASMSPEAQTWHHLIRASVLIDDDPSEAIPHARRAYDGALNREPNAPEADLLGRAAGTLGRAYMHNAMFADALPLLEKAVTLHLGREEARSRCYLATCMRLAGRVADAVEMASAGLAISAKLAGGSSAARSAEPFLKLELGRCQLARGDVREAIGCFESVRDRNEDDRGYPRIGALRGLAAAYRKVAAHEDARKALQACRRVAATTHGALQSVAAMAIGDALIDAEAGVDVGSTPDELLTEWRRLLPADAKDLDVRARIARQVY